ncbi:MAG: hypothetical protein LLG40_04190 [Deltaproteobacteria bacterium]|nr:hypothetical protein [Deltaproteobacteria bacterium]
MFNYNNIGNKLKSLAKLFRNIGLFLVVIVFIATIISSSSSLHSDETLLIGILTSIAIIIISFIGSWPLYGFGQLIEDTSMNVQLQKINNKMLKDLLAQKTKNSDSTT